MDTDFFLRENTRVKSFFFRFEKPISKGSKTDQFFFGSLDSKNDNKTGGFDISGPKLHLDA
jgi:hypothetical protein